MAEVESPRKVEPGSLEQEAIARLQAAREWKSRRLLDFKECYFFVAPSRQRQLSSQTAPAVQTMLDEPELNTDFGFILVADFVTEVINTYMPEAQIWCERRAGMDVPEDAFDQVADDVRSADRKIFAAIKASNFYAELPKALNPDLAIGGAGLIINRPHAHAPIQCLAVPLREIEINLGPDGEIDDRFIVRFTRNVYVRKLLGDTVWNKLPDQHRQTIESKASGRSELCWGYWRKWEDTSDEVWQHVVMFNEEVIHTAEIRGEGSCEFLFFRFNPTSDWPWAIGPLIQGLPTIRQMDEFERQKVEAVERAVNPPIKYPDDSVANVEQGIEPGMGYPVAPGRGEDFGPLYQQPPLDPVMFELDHMEHRLRKLFYTDHPEQTGDTPPTLGQWLDELARMQRRIGMAGFSFWREGPMRIFLRFKYLLEKSGTLPPIKDKQGRLISTQPYNPAQRAAEQQEIATATQAIQIGGQAFPEEWKIVVDGRKTIENFVNKLRVQNIIAMRDAKQVEAALKQIAQLALARGKPGAEGPPEAAGAAGPGI